MAHLSGDASLLQAFADDRDVHQATAAEVFSTPLDAVSADQRRSAKAINFGLMYGMSAFGLARQLGIGRGDAQKYMDLYFERYPGVKRYMEETRRQAREAGYRRNSVRPPAVPAGDSIAQRRRCANTPNAAPSTRPCKARLPTSSSAP